MPVDRESYFLHIRHEFWICLFLILIILFVYLQVVSNVLFHCANAILLFWIIVRMTGDMWKGCLIAALFAIHPLHIQSVAWVAERKDVLSTFFDFLTVGSYLRYVRSPRIGKYTGPYFFYTEPHEQTDVGHFTICIAID